MLRRDGGGGANIRTDTEKEEGGGPKGEPRMWRPIFEVAFFLDEGRKNERTKEREDAEKRGAKKPYIFILTRGELPSLISTRARD
ncbi:unnamed protein product [Lampetra fluviatilis]